jgi:hypothetical protein
LTAVVAPIVSALHPVHLRWRCGRGRQRETLAAPRASRTKCRVTQTWPRTIRDPTPELLHQSAGRRQRLSAGSPVRVVTENWMALLSTAIHVHHLPEAEAGEITASGFAGHVCLVYDAADPDECEGWLTVGW